MLKGIQACLYAYSVQEGGHESELQPLGVAVTQTQGAGFSNLASNFGPPALATLAQF